MPRFPGFASTGASQTPPQPPGPTRQSKVDGTLGTFAPLGLFGTDSESLAAFEDFRGGQTLKGAPPRQMRPAPARRSGRRSRSCWRCARPERASRGRCWGRSRGRSRGRASSWLIVGGIDAALERQRGRRGLEGARGADQVADHRLLRAHRDRSAPVAEDALDGDGLHQVVEPGAGAVGVDVVDVGGVDLRLAEGRRHGQRARPCPRARGG